MPTITAKVSDELLAYIDLVSGGNRSEYLRRCLEAGPGDLESGLKIVTNQLSDVNRKLDYLFDRASDADFGSLRGFKTGWGSFLSGSFEVGISCNHPVFSSFWFSVF